MKKTFLILLFLTVAFFAISQNVGIGTASPTSKLHVVGTTRSTGNLSTDADLTVNNNAAIGGSIDPAFKLRVYAGNSRLGGDAQVTGNLAVGGDLDPLYRLRVYDGNARIGGEFHATGNVGIGSNPDANYKLRVYAGHSRFDGEAQVMSNMAIGGDVDNQYRLRVIGGDARIGGEFHATGNVGIGSTPDANYKLRVYAGNSRFDGNANITGNLDAGSIDVAGALTIGGKGSVRSNGPSHLRIGFESQWINHDFNPGETATWVVPITDFSGGNDDIRIFISQYRNEGGDNAFHFFGASITNINATENTCELKLKNLSTYQENLIGTVFITLIAKN